MKRSKIFLGATTCLLAIAGVAAANHFRSSITRWYVTNGGPLRHCVQTGIISCTYNAAKTTTCLYLYRVVGKPTQFFAVFTSGATGVSTRCLHKFVYTRND